MFGRMIQAVMPVIASRNAARDTRLIIMPSDTRLMANAHHAASYSRLDA